VAERSDPRRRAKRSTGRSTTTRGTARTRRSPSGQAAPDHAAPGAGAKESFDERAVDADSGGERGERIAAIASALADLADAVRALPAAVLDALPDEVAAALRTGARRLAGEYSEDEWGRDPEFERAFEPLLDFLYERWWRVTVVGVERLPARGPVLLVANHAGFLPWDALMVKTAVRRAHPSPRTIRFLELDWAFATPWLSTLVRKLGGVPATPYNALRLLEEGGAVLAFPEGVRAAQRRFPERYRIQRFGRGGVVEIALRARATLVPVAVVGSEEAHPHIADVPWLGRLFGLPTLPVTPTFPLLGPLGLVPLPARWRIEFCRPLELERVGPDAAEDRAYVFEVSEKLRAALQESVYANLAARGPAFF